MPLVACYTPMSLVVSAMPANKVKNATQRNPQNAKLNCATMCHSNQDCEASLDAPCCVLQSCVSVGFNEALKQGQKRDTAKCSKRGICIPQQCFIAIQSQSFLAISCDLIHEPSALKVRQRLLESHAGAPVLSSLVTSGSRCPLAGPSEHEVSQSVTQVSW